ncbi:hypothetical protein EDB81DRAFT_150920 [Dactylonectria macrodidyma]|uniref:Secreted protein n=1 Tax=Dactylonectria macrodidyma TaxID=307937 RepID=A0A9P9JG87_9HYPO|nr:hypothetical protein EDB81DRAFT_150920 [Dactylonectria macrodidyma]
MCGLLKLILLPVYLLSVLQYLQQSHRLRRASRDTGHWNLPLEPTSHWNLPRPGTYDCGLRNCHHLRNLQHHDMTGICHSSLPLDHPHRHILSSITELDHPINF